MNMPFTKKVFALVCVLVLGFPVAASAIVNPDPVHSKNVPSAVVALHLYADKTPAGGTQYCSGTVIAPVWVLTAGHCVFSKMKPSDMYVSTLVNRQRVTAKVVGIFVHPRFDVSWYSVSHDVALLKLEAPIPGVEPIPAVGKNDQAALEDPQGFLLYGWGFVYTGTPDSKDNRPGYLNDEPLLPTRPRGVVQFLDQNPKIEYDPRMHIAALHVSGGLMQGSCNGDSGGPLVSAHGGKLRVVGVVSYGLSECLEDVAGINTRVSRFSGWIRNTMRNNQEDSSVSQAQKPVQGM